MLLFFPPTELPNIYKLWRSNRLSLRERIPINIPLPNWHRGIVIDFKTNTFKLIICIFLKNKHWYNRWDSLLFIRNKPYVIIHKTSRVFEVKQCTWRNRIICLKPYLLGQLVGCELVNVKQLGLENISCSNPIHVYFSMRDLGTQICGLMTLVLLDSLCF